MRTTLQATREDYDEVGNIKHTVYAAVLRAVDRSVGRSNGRLKAEGLADNTIVVLTSDDGGSDYIGLPDINKPYRGWKLTHFEGGLRVPLFIKRPARIKARTMLRQPVAHIDMMPTLLAAAEAPASEDVEIDCNSVLSLATGDGAQDWKYEKFWQSGEYLMVRHGDWKLQVSARPNAQWIYNLGEDPTVQNNVAKDQPAKGQQLMALLSEHHGNVVTALYPSVIKTVIPVDKAKFEAFKDGDEFVYFSN